MISWFLFATLLASNLALVGLCVLMYRKTSRIDRQVWNLRDQLADAAGIAFKQIEALGALEKTLALRTPLPPTRGWAGSPDFLLSIAKKAIDMKPAVIAECSCGVSTIVLARCAQLSGVGHVYSLESDPRFAEMTRRDLARHGLTEFATIFDAPLTKPEDGASEGSWYRVPADFPANIDMLVIDGPPATHDPMARAPAGPALFPRMRRGEGVVFLDDFNRDGERRIVEAWKADFPGIVVQSLDCEKGCAEIHL